MTRDDQVLELLGEANPVSDPSRLAIPAATRARFETIEQWSGDMEDTELRTIEPPTARSRRAWLVAAAAAVLVLVVGLGAWIVFDRTTGDADVITPDTTIPLIGADGDAAAQEAFANVESAFAAHNSGDFDTWYLWREGDAPSGEYGYELAVGGRLNVEQCTSRGFQTWTMGWDGPLTGHGFDCAVTYTDRLFEPAGIEFEVTYRWVIGADPESSQGGSNEDGRVWDRFMRELREWLTATHPEVAATIQYVDGDLTPESVPIILDYIDEFVAESDAYPLTEPVPEHPDFGGPLQ